MLSPADLRAKYPEFTALTGLSRGQVEKDTGFLLGRACNYCLIVGILRIGEQLYFYANGTKDYARLPEIAEQAKLAYASPVVIDSDGTVLVESNA